jgi:alpha-galactosidase
MPFLDLEQIPSFSFVYHGEPSASLLPGWQRQETVWSYPGGSQALIYLLDPLTGLKIRLTVSTFCATGALDWMVEFENTGKQDTPLIENILPLDILVPLPERERLRIHHARGSSCRMDDFLPLTTELKPAEAGWSLHPASLRLAPQGGRSSNGTLPFVNLQRQGCGMVLGVGWSGQWQASFERSREGLLLKAGMERTALTLRPAEKMRTPRLLLLPWEGADPDLGTNLLRRVLIDHYLPRLDGKLVLPPSAQSLQAYFYLTGQAGEGYELRALPRAAALDLEAYWIDACWYGGQGEWWQEVGSWEVNRSRFPGGLRPISEAAHREGMQFVLWFEPERIRPNSRLHREHPEFLLSSPHDADNLLFNLGNPQAWQYLVELISHQINAQGVDIYRQDFNFDPWPYWQAADEPGRVGMTEIRYVEGLYAFWDELRRRHPRLWIDNCASGGRRIDVETLKRALPLWPSDFLDTVGLCAGAGLHIGNQCVSAGLARWVPLMGGGVWNFSPYSTRSHLTGGFTFGFHIAQEDLPAGESEALLSPNEIMARGKSLLDEDFPMGQARAALAEWRSVRPFFLGDFYLLLPLTVSPHDWCAWQFHRADLQAGVALFFRRHLSPFPNLQVSLRGLEETARYEVSLSAEYQEEPRRLLESAELARLTVDIAEAPGSRLLRYRRVA